MSRGWPRVLDRRDRITKLVCPRSLMPQIHECHEVVKTGYLPLFTSLHSKRSFSEYVSNWPLSGEESKKEWAFFFHPLLGELHESKYLSLVHHLPGIAELHPPHDQFEIWIDRRLTSEFSLLLRKKSRRSQVCRKYAGCYDSNKDSCNTLEDLTVSGGFLCTWRGNWQKSIANLRDHPRLPFELLLKQEDLGEWIQRANQCDTKCLFAYHQKLRKVRLIVTSVTTFGILAIEWLTGCIEYADPGSFK